ncbi:unnamed protein product [Thlaspi arvense]|uniref:Transmembrane protein n=1 Tax=Thlaspi arvense TaxID=13288 RepID=A0AAU9SSF6_THLAR|nr:unnamed protein product [Thlaspi arvense]
MDPEDFNIFSTSRKLISSLQYPDDLDVDHSDIQSPVRSRQSIKLRKQFPIMAAETMSSSTVVFSEETTPQTQMIMGEKKKKIKKMSYAKLVIAISFVAVVLFTSVSVMMLMQNQDGDVGYYTVPT